MQKCLIWLSILCTALEAMKLDQSVLERAYRRDVWLANSLLDLIVERLDRDPSVSAALDPLTLDEVIMDRGRIFNVSVEGLSRLRRSADTVLRLRNAYTVTIEGQLTFGNLFIKSMYQFKPISVLELEGHMDVILTGLTVGIEIRVQHEVPVLTQFKVIEFGEADVTRFTGATIALNWLGRILTTELLRQYKEYIVITIETKAKSFIDSVLENIQLPFRSKFLEITNHARKTNRERRIIRRQH
ncbi:hypothetical protein MTO96_009905 [Rhipicephalus appendiculatus]|uniref:Tick salivary protein-SALP15 n=1 Tax=Rhipicephalus appendiculatus TaxID=34631 RepID=A0A131YT86_RHIAP